jgi:hypothetical protein
MKDKQDDLEQEKSIIDHLDQLYQAKLVQVYLEVHHDFKLPLT